MGTSWSRPASSGPTSGDASQGERSSKMSGPRVKSSRLTRYATLMMIALGVLTILVNTTVAVVLIALGVAMYLFELRLVRGVQRSVDSEE
jgi:Flp pilus assembly protein TadB